jgi:hypothetical protein
MTPIAAGTAKQAITMTGNRCPLRHNANPNQHATSTIAASDKA